MHSAISVLVIGLLAFCSTQVNSEELDLILTAEPGAAIEGITQELELECRPHKSSDKSSTVAGLNLILIKQGEDGSTTTIASQSERNTHVSDQQGNRTLANGNMFSESNPDPTYLTVTISEPMMSDQGQYSCFFIYFDMEGEKPKAGSLSAYLDVAVMELPEAPNKTEPTVTAPLPYVTEYIESNVTECGCDDIRQEVQDLRETLVLENQQLRDQLNSYDDTCRISFSAMLNTQRVSLALFHGSKLPFGYVTSNKGSSYDADTYELTAPCDGQYQFSLTLHSVIGFDAGYVSGAVTVDGAPAFKTFVFTDKAQSHSETGSNSGIVTLTKGQKVSVKLATSARGSVMGGESSIFSGFFLSP